MLMVHRKRLAPCKIRYTVYTEMDTIKKKKKNKVKVLKVKKNSNRGQEETQWSHQ